MKYIVYLHGFNSSPQSEKARLTKGYFQAHCGQLINVIVPALPPAPLEAIAYIHSLIEHNGRDNLLGFIGSSLGGFYSLYLQRFYASSLVTPKAVLINPAVRPYNLLQDYLGENQNLYTGEKYIIEPEHMDDLSSLIVQPVLQPKLTFLLTQTADEVLNYQDAVSYLAGVSMWIQFGGSHAFDHYLNVLPGIRGFFERV